MANVDQYVENRVQWFLHVKKGAANRKLSVVRLFRFEWITNRVFANKKLLAYYTFNTLSLCVATPYANCNKWIHLTYICVFIEYVRWIDYGSQKLYPSVTWNGLCGRRTTANSLPMCFLPSADVNMFCVGMTFVRFFFAF